MTSARHLTTSLAVPRRRRARGEIRSTVSIGVDGARRETGIALPSTHPTPTTPPRKPEAFIVTCGAAESESTAEYNDSADGADGVVPVRSGTVIAGRYRLLRRLGSGASAHVWIAHDGRLDRDVALKILHGGAAEGGAEQERLRREAHALAHLAHPRITAVLDLVEDADAPGRAPVLVTELLSGEDLGARLKRGALDLDETLTLCAQLADALDTAHRAGVIHRDVKPANVMLTPTGVKLLDFGIARTSADSDLTGATAIGTPACMAPEQWLGKRAEPAADVYALGCLLHWCLTGRAPFAHRILPALAMAHLQAEPPALPNRGQRPEIDALYSACLAKEPEHRPAAGDVAMTLRGAASVERSRGAIGINPRRRMPVGARAAVIMAASGLIVVGAVAVPLAASSSADRPATLSVPSVAPTSPHADTAATGQAAPTSGARSTASAARAVSVAAPGTVAAPPAAPTVVGVGANAPGPVATPPGKAKPKRTPPGHTKH
jgi:serine/threonine-protein kinase